MNFCFSHQNSHFFVVAVVGFPLEFSQHVTDNMSCMMSSPSCAAGTIFVIV